MVFDNWPLWKRAVALNILGLAGVAIGVALADVKLPPNVGVPIAVFTLAGLNFLFLVVRPQLIAAGAIGHPGPASRVLVRVVGQRPLVLLLVINQLIGVAQLLAAAVIIAQLLMSGRIHALPNGSNPGGIVSASVMTAIAALWLLSAIGLWRSRTWAWWLALFLNGVDVVTTIGVGLLSVLVLRHGFLFGWRAAVSVIACVLLLLPVVRDDVRHRSSALVTS